LGLVDEDAAGAECVVFGVDVAERLDDADAHFRRTVREERRLGLLVVLAERVVMPLMPPSAPLSAPIR
jgi:hypothetical protein